MKNVILLLIFLFSLVFAAPDGKPLGFVEKRNKLNKDINNCILKGGVSDVIKNKLNEEPQEDVSREDGRNKRMVPLQPRNAPHGGGSTGTSVPMGRLNLNCK